MLPFGLFCGDSLEKVEISFGVGELLKLFDLQASVFVGNDVSDEDHLAVHVYTDRGLSPTSELQNYISTSDIGLNA